MLGGVGAGGGLLSALGGDATATASLEGAIAVAAGVDFFGSFGLATGGGGVKLAASGSGAFVGSTMRVNIGSANFASCLGPRISSDSHVSMPQCSSSTAPSKSKSDNLGFILLEYSDVDAQAHHFLHN